jgi:hypothetical protein
LREQLKLLKEKEKTKQVRLIGTIYVEPLASCAPTIEEIRIYERE